MEGTKLLSARSSFVLALTKYTLFYKNVVFPAQAEYSYFSADFRLKTFLHFS